MSPKKLAFVRNTTALRGVTLALLCGAIQLRAQSITFDFQDGTDQGFGSGFGNDASASFPIVSIGGSLRMEVLDTAAFQQAGRESQGADAFLAAMNAATANPSGYTISYDWYIDTSLSAGLNGTFLQLGTYINSGAGAYAQDFPGAGKDAELNAAQLASGQVFSGTVSETVTQKYGAPGAAFQGQIFMRFGLISNGDGTQARIYYDNITIAPIEVPEISSLPLLGLAAPALWMMLRRRSIR